MKDDFRRLVKSCIKGDGSDALEEEQVAAFCVRYGMENEQFEYVFAQHVATEFAIGELSYSEADGAINWLASRANPSLSDLPLEIYLAFDDGEYIRRGDAATLIPWQKYTLPSVMKILLRENWLPRTYSED